MVLPRNNTSLFFVLLFSGIFCSPLLAQRAPVPVFVADVKRSLFVDNVEALGTLQSNENVEITSTVTELVTKINFEDGQRVKKGYILVEMDAAEEIAERVEEQSRINEARKQLDRLKSLVKRDVASQAALDERKRELQTAQARLKAIESRISQHVLTAPFDGIVGLRNISVGTLAQPGSKIATLDDNSVMKLDFAIPEVFLATLKAGIAVKAYTAVYPNSVFEGVIHSIDTRVNPVTRSITARARLENADRRLKAGMLMRVVVNKNPRQAVIIPEESLITRGDKQFVMVIEHKNDKTYVQQQPIKLGNRRKGDIEILSGLEAGQQVVIHGTLRVRPGSEVMIQGVEKDNDSVSDFLESDVENQKNSASRKTTP